MTTNKTIEKILKEFDEWEKEAIRCWEISNGVTDHCPICGIKPKEMRAFLKHSIEQAVEERENEIREVVNKEFFRPEIIDEYASAQIYTNIINSLNK